MGECEHKKTKEIGIVQIISDNGKIVGRRLFWYCDECGEQWETEESLTSMLQVDELREQANAEEA